MTTRPLGVQISHMLKARGIDTIFGIPGVHNQELYRGIAETGLRHVLARHEQGAGFMADGYARATGKPGVAYVISGPGLTNILTPLGQAYSDSVPVLCISSCLDDTGALRGQLHQMLDQAGAADTVCDWSLTAADGAGAYGLIDRALGEFVTTRPRPKSLAVPIKLLEGAAPPPPPAPPRAVRTVAPPAAMADAVRRVRDAKRPLFILGGGAAGAMVPARAALAALGAASFATYAGRGIAAPGDALHLGAYLARPSSVEVLDQADLIVAIGTELAEVDLWRPSLGMAAPILRVDIDPAVLGDGHMADGAGLLTDAAAFLRALAEAAPPGGAPAWDGADIARHRARWKAEVDAERPGIVPICDTLRAALPPDTTICSDMTQFAYAAKEVWDMAAPGLWHHPTGFGTLGYALPAAIGAKVGLGAAPVIAIAGDYGVQYTIQELATAVAEGLSLPILIWDNAKLGEIEASMVSAQIAPYAVDVQNPDFLALARAYGARASAPASLGELAEAVTAALATDGPTVIRVTPALNA